MPPTSKRSLRSPTGSRSETVVLSKTDALGDQIIAIGLANAVLQHRPRARLVWFVRAGNESLASLLKGSRVYRPDLAQPPASEARKALQGLRMGRSNWGRVVFIPVPINPYQEQRKAAKAQMEWWIAFSHGLEAKLAVAGSTTRNWLDQVLVASTEAVRRVGFGPSPGSQELIPWNWSLMRLRESQKLLTEEIAFPEDLNERERLHLLADTVCRKEVPYTITINPRKPPEPIDLTGVSRVLAIAPGVGDPRRSVKPSSLCDGVADFLSGKPLPEQSCLIIEGPFDRAIASEVSKGLRKRGIKSTRQRFDADDLPNLVALLKKTPLFLTHETFYAQIAAITKTPTVAIWGLGHWQRFFPEDGRMTIVHTSMPCRNCGWHCYLDRWRCITDISSAAITEGLLSQWRHRSDRGIRFVKSPSPVPEKEVLESLKKAGFRSVQLESENRNLREWNESLSDQITDLRKWAEEEQVLRGKSEALFADAEKQSEDAKGAQREERRLRVTAGKLLRDTEIQRDNAKKAQKEEHRLRVAAESLLRETEKQREDMRTWAEKEQGIRKNTEALLADAEKQSGDAKKAQKEEHRLRVTAESLLRETEKQRNDLRTWAEEEQGIRKNAEALLADAEKQSDEARKTAAEEHQLRETAESLLRETEKQRNEACDWAEKVDKLWRQLQTHCADIQRQRDETTEIAAEERRQRESAETRLAETLKQADDLRDWAEQEQQLRREAESLYIEAEKQRDDHRNWAEQERQLRREAESLRTDAEKQRDDGAAWAREEKRLRTKAETLLADAGKQRDDLRAWAEEERELRQSAQDLLQTEEKQVRILRCDLDETNEVLERKTRLIEETAVQVAALKEELRQTKEARYRYERLGACRLAADIADRWNRGKRKISKK